MKCQKCLWHKIEKKAWPTSKRAKKRRTFNPQFHP